MSEMDSGFCVCQINLGNAVNIVLICSIDWRLRPLMHRILTYDHEVVEGDGAFC